MDIAHCYLDGNADCVEFCPHVGFENVLAASTYTLQERDRPSRLGSISLFDVDAGNHRLELFHRVETTGIFDMKWNPGGSNVSPFLAQADADGYLRIYSIDCPSEGTNVAGTSLKESINIQVSSSMCLYLDWNPSGTSLTVGLSDGSVSIVSFSDSGLQIQEAWKAHEFELWTTSFDIHRPYLVYTGSDDCKFRGWDLRQSPSTQAFQNSKAHKMGVCCIVKNPCDPHTLLTGSYDECLRVWDVRLISRPVSETSIGLGGGVWRVKYHPSVQNLVLAACMHNGFAVLNMNKVGPEVVETYAKHESLAYGADWQRGRSDEKCTRKINVAATCSFYDRLLRVWIPENTSTFDLH